MFPSIDLYWYTIYFQWLGIVLATLIFIYWVYRYSKKYNLRFPFFLNFLAFFIIIPYFLWRYVYDFLEYKFYFPTDILNLLSPYDYRFSFIWVSFWIAFVIFMFLLSIQYIQERKKWVDVFFFAITLSMIIIWPFLLLWDSFYWTTTNSIFGITPFTANTQIPYTTPIWPIWIFVSILWIILYILAKIIIVIFKKPGITIYLLPFMFLWFAYIFRFQQYPKHFLFGIDIKILYCYIMAVFSVIMYYFLLRKKNLLEEKK